MTVKIDDIIDAVDFDSYMSESFLNTKTEKVCIFTHDELQAAEKGVDLSDSAQWYCEAVASSKYYLENQQDYLSLPEKYDFNEYRIMEKFIARVVIPTQSEMLYQSIKGKGAFRRFKTVLTKLGLVDEWYEYRGKKLREFVEFWCEENKVSFE
ncbi:hypothetical protein EKO29_04625 [Colwellia sp. Arc7-635]|uniref:UPF0158 family protein n=1 Tax=Colwellia sp. Arc7-635 TaxID=2497879 RepID=UPI000F8506B1|nr:UPF0158 family protein [Colwellia sp. Arc7-635]AZQ83397.1 hypothetical protein EKO29_04625 [Colwellia sp. Arc7-635]